MPAQGTADATPGGIRHDGASRPAHDGAPQDMGAANGRPRQEAHPALPAGPPGGPPSGPQAPAGSAPAGQPAASAPTAPAAPVPASGGSAGGLGLPAGLDLASLGALVSSLGLPPLAGAARGAVACTLHQGYV